MGYTAVVHLVGNFGQVKFIIYQQFFYPFNLMCNKEFFNGRTLYF